MQRRRLYNTSFFLFSIFLRISKCRWLWHFVPHFFWGYWQWTSFKLGYMAKFRGHCVSDAREQRSKSSCMVASLYITILPVIVLSEPGRLGPIPVWPTGSLSDFRSTPNRRPGTKTLSPRTCPPTFNFKSTSATSVMSLYWCYVHQISELEHKHIKILQYTYISLK